MQMKCHSRPFACLLPIYPGSWPADAGAASLSPVTLGQGFDQRCLHTRDVLAHQHLRPPRLAGRDCLIDPMMIVVAAADVAMLEGNDVSARRHRHMVADPDHLG